MQLTNEKAENANLYNRNFLDSIHIAMRVIDSVEPNLTAKIFGEEYSSPIMMTVFSHLNKVGKEEFNKLSSFAY